MLLVGIYWLCWVAYAIAVALFVRAAWGKTLKEKRSMISRHNVRAFFMVVLFIPFIMLSNSLLHFSMWYLFGSRGIPASSEEERLFHAREHKVYEENVKLYCNGLAWQSCNMKLNVMERNSYKTEEEYRAAVKQYCQGMSELECDRRLNQL